MTGSADSVLQELLRRLQAALSSQDSSSMSKGRLRVLAVSLVAAHSVVRLVPLGYRRVLWLVVANILQAQSEETAGVSPAAQSEETAGVSPAAQNGETAGLSPETQSKETAGLSPETQSNETTRLSPETQSNETMDRQMRLLGLLSALWLLGSAARAEAPRPRLGELLAAHVRSAALDPDTQFDDLPVAGTSVASVAWLAAHIAGDVRVERGRGLLYYVQCVGDAVAARAAELGKGVAVALPPQLRARHGADAYVYGRWDVDADAGRALRRALLGVAAVALEHWVQPGDELRFEPAAVGTAAVVHVVWRRVRDDQPAAAYSMPGGIRVAGTADGVRVEAPGALTARAVSGRVSELRRLPAVDINSHAVLDLPATTAPSLGEFQAMLRGARVVVRAGAGASAPVRAAAAYLAEDAGCSVEWVDAFAARSPGTPGLSKHLVAQRPPAYVLIDDDVNLLRAEFEMLRGTLSFASKPVADAQARRGFYAATLGIIVLAPPASVARLRECVRMLRAVPHALPPPVVCVVPLPVAERRLLAALQAAWDARRHERQAGMLVTPGRGSPHVGSSYIGSTHTFVSSSSFVTAPESAHSTPLSSASESLYHNVRTVGGSPGIADSAGLMTWPRTPGAAVANPQYSSLQPTEASGLHVITDAVSAQPELEPTSARVQTPPSPLIEVESSLARALRCASTSHADSGEANVAAAAAAATVAVAAASSTSELSTSIRSSRRISDFSLDTTSLRSAENIPVVTTEPISALSPAEAAIVSPRTSSDLAEQRSLSRTRSRIREKMALFNRAKQMARNKLLGSHETTADDKGLAKPADKGVVKAADKGGAEPGESQGDSLVREVVAPSRMDQPPASPSPGKESSSSSSPRKDRSLSVARSEKSSLKQSASGVDLDKPLPKLPLPPPSSVESTVKGAGPEMKQAEAEADVVAGDTPETNKSKAPVQDRKARLRARLQNANRKLAESKKEPVGADAPETADDNDAAAAAAARPTSVRSGDDNDNDKEKDKEKDEAKGAETKLKKSRKKRAKKLLSGPVLSLDGIGNSTPPIRVLLVEDNLINRNIMERFLKHMNVYFDVASNGEEAIAMWTAASAEGRDADGAAGAGHGPYHIVFMDIQMPVMDGITATKYIRRLERQRRIGLWVPTGSVASMQAERSPGEGPATRGSDSKGQGSAWGPASAGLALRGTEDNTPRTVRWIPFHVRRLPAGARNAHYLHKNGLVQSVPTAVGAAEPLVDHSTIVRRNSSLTVLKRSPLGPGVNIARRRRAATMRSKSASRGGEYAMTPMGLQVEGESPPPAAPKTGPLVSPNELDSDSLRQVAMFPPDAVADSHTSNEPALLLQAAGGGGAWRKRLPQSLQLPLPSPHPQQRVREMLAQQDSPQPSSAPVKAPVIIVALTASSLESDRVAALAAGCNDFLTKPVSLIWLKLKIIEWGCMQALIDHDGWRKWRSKRTTV